MSPEMASEPWMPSKSGAAPSVTVSMTGGSYPPGDFPAISQAEKFLSRGDFGGAVRVAFPLVMVDVQWVYNLAFPRHWTSRDVLAHGLRPDMGRLPDLLFQLYQLYEPVRYGQERDWVRGDLREILRRIYSDTALRDRQNAIEQAGTVPVAPTTFSVVPGGAPRNRPGEEGRRW